MGVAISNLIEANETSIDRLQGKIIAVDAMNMLYQFISTIRQYDGTPLKDSQGRITSHLSGLFSRCTRLMQKGIKLVFVFDGDVPELKKEERARRETAKRKALSSYEEAKESKDVQGMKKFAARTAKITPEILTESKKLLTALGIPIITAPSEGEAQAARMVNDGTCDYVASQDIDCLIYGAKQVVRNLSLSQKRKKINALTYRSVFPEIVRLKDVLSSLNISLTQLRALAMLVGTDFNIGGIKGVGPKKGLALVKKHGEDLQALFKEVKFDEQSSASWNQVYKTIAHMQTTENYDLSWQEVNERDVKELLVDKHDFSSERVNNSLETLKTARSKTQQTGLDTFF